MEIDESIKNLRLKTGMNRKAFAEYFEIPLRTVEDWEAGRRKPPEYIPRLLDYRIRIEFEKIVGLTASTEINDKRNVNVVIDAEGNKIVLINDILFKGKRSVNWSDVKEYLKTFVGKYYMVSDTDDEIYIGNDLPDEYTGSKYTYTLKGANAKAKANASQGIPELIEIATNSTYKETKKEKHKKDAAFGWYRYESRFALPVYGQDNEIERYNVFHVYLIIRHCEDGKKYLYDILDIRKETSNPLEQ